MIKRTFIAFAWLLLALSWPHASLAEQYDHYFRQSFARWMPGHDWQLLKAQCIVESHLRPQAVSPAGAKGICQFMPPTWAEAERYKVVPVGTNPFEARWNIEAGAWYVRKMHGIWVSERPPWDHYQLMWASYNAGAGHIIKAQRLCGMALRYEPIMQCLPQVTGHHAEETRQYAPRIERQYKHLKHVRF